MPPGSQKKGAEYQIKLDDNMPPYLQRHRPLIASRIEFTTFPHPTLSSIRSRIEFTSERLASTDDEVNIAQDRGATTIGRLGAKHKLGDPGPERPSIQSTRKPDKIPKPPGEPGRPGSGGFGINATLIKLYGWNRKSVEELMAAVRTAARKDLDVTVSFRNQDPIAIQNICAMMTEENKWPILDTYEDCWPVRSMLKLALKSSAEASRRAAIKNTNEHLRATLTGQINVAQKVKAREVHN